MFKTLMLIILPCLLAFPAMAADGLPQVAKGHENQALDGEQANQLMTVLITKILNSIDFTTTTISISAKDIKIGKDNSGRNSIESLQDLNASANVIFKQDILISTDEMLQNLPMQAQFKDLIPKISILLSGKQLVASVTSEGIENFKISAGFYSARQLSDKEVISLPITLGNSVSPNLLELKFTNLTIELSAPNSEEKATAIKELNLPDKSDLKVTTKITGNCSLTDGTKGSNKFNTCVLNGYYFLNTRTNKSFPAIKFKVAK